MAEMGAFGDGSTFKYWYVGAGWSDADTWLQVNSTSTTVKGALVTKGITQHTNGHIYLEGSNAGSSTGNST